MSPNSKHHSILPDIYRLLTVITLVAFAIIASASWYLVEHQKVDDIRFTYHAGSSRHISEIYQKFIVIKTELQHGYFKGHDFVHEGPHLPHDHQITKAIHIAAEHAEELNLLQEKYRINDLQLLIDQFNALFKPILDHAEPGGNNGNALSVDSINAVLLKLEQLRRQHRISSSRLIVEAEKQEQILTIGLAAFIAIVMLVSAIYLFGILDRIKKLIRQQQKDEQALSEEKELLQTTLSSIGDAVITTDDNGKITSMNPVAEQLTGWSNTEALGKSVHVVFPIIDASTRQPIENPIEKVLTTGEIVYLSNHTTLISNNGEEYQIADSAAPIRIGEDSHIQGMVLVFNDVSEQYRLRAIASKNRRDLNAIMDFSPAVIQLRDLEGRYILVNKRFENLFDQKRADVIGRTPYELFSRDLADQILADDSLVASSREAREIEENALHCDGDNCYVTTKFPLLDDRDEVYAICSISTDITARKRQEEKIAHQAHFDSLTDLPNRFLSLDRLSQLMNDAGRRNLQVAVLFIDLDDFKKVNDTLGHETGDKLLITAANRLRQAVRKGDTVGRLGGDEFIVLLGGLSDSAESTPVVENLLEQFRRPFNVDGRDMLLTASIGIALFPTDGKDASELLRNADSAMYHAKERGRNIYSYFTEAMNQEVSRRLAIEEQLHGAINRGEFSVAYQPQVEVNTQKTVGAEALLRWNNAALGEVSPVEFIPIAEHTGLIVDLGKFVINDAIANIAKWHKNHEECLHIAVNLSPRQFRDLELVDFIQQQLQQYSVPANCLELEITEGVLLTGYTETNKILDTLSDMGVHIAMDDFGTGYSSLSYLRNYPFDILKIDRSFVKDITHGTANKALVSATIAMARALNVSVIAEGVETEEQLKELERLGCDFIQGYYISKPVTAEKLAEFLAR